MPDNAWSLIFDPKYASKLKGCGVNFLDSASEVLPVALLYVGKPAYRTNAADYDAAAKMLKSVRPYVTRFSSSGYINDLAGGSLCAVMGFSGDINIARARALEANPKQPAAIEALVPKGGATLFFDSMAIPKDAKNVANAHLFINYILRPEVAAALTNKVFYANPNAASLKFVKKDVAEQQDDLPVRRRQGADDAARRRAAGDPPGADAGLHQLQGRQVEPPRSLRSLPPEGARPGLERPAGKRLGDAWPYCSATFTPFQNATRPLISLAASLGSG